MKHWARAAAVVGAVLIVLAVVLRVWWSYEVPGETLLDQGGHIGLYHGTWYSPPFGHDVDMAFHHGKAASVFGAIAFFAGLVAAAALLMTALGSGDRIKPMAGAAQLACGVCMAAAVAALATHHHYYRGVESGGIGPVLLGAGVLVGVVGARRVHGEWKRTLPLPATTVITIAACALTLLAVVSHGFWHWTWSDERNEVGLVEATRCWRGLDHCATEHMGEPFMLDNERVSNFERTARQTHGAGIAVVVLAVLGLIVRRKRTQEVAHAPWIVLLLLACATLAMTPDENTARDVHIGLAFPALFIGCVAGIAGSLLRE